LKKTEKYFRIFNHFGIEQQNGKPKKKNYNKPRNSNETENLKRKITTNREIFASFIIISELSNKAENLKRKIAINRKIKQI
jgi:hypothetical protein